MIPHERSLVKKLEGKPFALLGIDLDATKADLKKAEEKHKVTWRSWCDGGEGPIARTWNIKFIPMVYVLDQKGVIRYKNVQGEQLDQAVETLLKETEGGK
jgi:hypothetical protein